MTETESEHCALCVYCLKVSDGSGFNREHIIPQSIGGTLFVDNMVCEECNSILGREVDCEILKVPDVLAAMDDLEIPYNRQGILRSYYSTELVSETVRLRARPTENGFSLPNQKLDDGSLITPGHEVATETLRTMLMRDVNLQNSDLSEEQQNELLGGLGRKYATAEDGEDVKCEELGLVLVRRSEVLQPVATPRSEARVDRLVGKIALEWLFFCFGKTFVGSATWSVDLRNLVCGSETPNEIHVYRSVPIDSTVRRTHYIYVYLHESFTRVVVAFFGAIEYTVIAPGMPGYVLKEFTNSTNTPDAAGVAYEQDLSSGDKRFFALLADGSSKYLGHL